MAIDPFWGNLFRRDSKEKNELFNILKKVPIFQDLNRRELNKIEVILHRRSYAADESIVKEGELSVVMYIIVNGQVDIIHSGEDGKILRLATFGPGDFFGEQALLDESHANYEKLARQPDAPGGLLTIELNFPVADFYDRIRIIKSPSFGTL